MSGINSAVKRMDGVAVGLLDGVESRYGSLIFTTVLAVVIGSSLYRGAQTDWRMVIMLAGTVMESVIRSVSWPREFPRIRIGVMIAMLLGILAVNLLKVPGSREFFRFWNVVVAVLLPVCLYRLVRPPPPRRIPG